MSYMLAIQSVVVAVPATAAFSYAANLENFSAWFPGALSIQARDSRAIDEVGKSYEEIVILPFGRSAKVLIQVVEASYPSLLITEGDYQVLLPRMELHFKSIDDQETLVEWRMYSRRSDTLFRLLRPMFSLVLKSRSRYALKALKVQLESHTNDMS